MARPKVDFPPAEAIRALADGEGRLALRVTPGARSEGIEVGESRVLVKVRAKPQDGAANEAVLAMLAAGALLSPGRQIPPREIWVGRPAKFLRTQDEAQVEKIRFQTERYCRLAERHMAELGGKAQA